MNNTLIQKLFSAFLRGLKVPLRSLWRFFTDKQSPFEAFLVRYWWVWLLLVMGLGVAAELIMRNIRREQALRSTVTPAFRLAPSNLPGTQGISRSQAAGPGRVAEPMPYRQDAAPTRPRETSVPDWREQYRRPETPERYEPVSREVSRPVFDEEEPSFATRRSDVVKGYAPPVTPYQLYSGNVHPGLPTQTLEQSLPIQRDRTYGMIHETPFADVRQEPEPEPVGFDRLRQKAKRFLASDETTAIGRTDLPSGNLPGLYFQPPTYPDRIQNGR